MDNKYRKTIYACFTGYIVQAIVNNFVPLLFLTFESTYHIPLGKITILITFNFGIQLLVDLLSAGFVDKIGYRASIVAAHIFSAAGLLGLAFLPKLLPDAYAGLLISVVIYALGGGLLEVLVSPIVESCPTENKEKAMSLLHSFYCWGQVAVVLLTTVAVRVIGEGLWWTLPLVWALLPFYNCFAFARAPLRPTVSPEEKVPLRSLFRSRLFVLAMLLMLCAGASELAMSQWSSLFAEQALGVQKLWGDLLGPCLFAVFMGIGRTIYGVFGARMDLYRWLLGTALLCVLCYMGAALLAVPMLSLLCCALCGFSISLMWPGVLSSTAAAYPKGGAAMFGLLAVCGDIGCSSGPALAGMVSELAGLRAGMLSAAVFPLVMVACLLFRARNARVQAQK